MINPCDGCAKQYIEDSLLRAEECSRCIRNCVDKFETYVPPNKIIDLTPLINKNIDCVFGDHGRVASLADIVMSNGSGIYYPDNSTTTYPSCTVRLNHWNVSDGGHFHHQKGFTILPFVEMNTR